jgi:hypothetical protein
MAWFRPNYSRGNGNFRQGWLIGVALLLFLAALFATACLRAAATSPDVTKFTDVPPFADLAAQAQTQKIPLSGIDPPGKPGVLEPGDSFLAIVTLFEKGKRTQWLLFLRVLPSKPNEPSNKAREAMVLYSGRSNRFEFASSPVPARLQTVGPFTGKSFKPVKSKEQSKDFVLDKGYLGLGLDQAVATVYRATQAGENGRFYFSPKPPDAQQMAVARRVGDHLHLTLDEERSLAGAIPAMLSYFNVVQQTEGLEDILLKVVRKPSLWSIIKNVGVSVDLRFDAHAMIPAPTAPWGAFAGSASSLYYVPISVDLNHQPALRVTFVVTNPRPPLLSCGGIIGMLAEKPGDNETYMILRIVSARMASAQAGRSAN